MEVNHNAGPQRVRRPIGITTDGFNENFHLTTQQTVHLRIIIIVVPYTVKTLDVFPNGRAIFTRIDVVMIAHSEYKYGTKINSQKEKKKNVFLVHFYVRYVKFSINLNLSSTTLHNWPQNWLITP